MTNDTKKTTSDWELLKFFAKFLRPYWKWVLLGTMAVPITIATTIFMPWLIITIIDDYIVPGDYNGLYVMCGLLAGSVFLGYLADSTYTYSLQRAGQLAITKMRGELFSHSLTLTRSYFDKKPIGVTLSRMTSDMEAIGESLTIGALSMITDLVKTVALLGFLFYISWKLTLLILLILPPIYLVISVLRKKLRLYFNATREALANATAFLQESLNGMKTIQLYAAEKKVLKQFDDRNREFFQAQIRSNFYDASLYSIIEGLTSITMGLLIWYGTGQILSGLITIGVMIGFINTLNKIFVPIRDFAQHIALIQRSLSALEQIDRLFRETTEENGETLTPEMERKLERFESLRFDDVSFRYTDDGPVILKNVSFTLKQGERIAIVGATGSGKSTILRILTKTYMKYEGSITINGIELRNIPKDRLNHVFALMQQDVYLFNESIEFNISLERPGIDQDKVRQAADYVYAKGFIESFPEQYGYKVADNGRNLSAGQGQLLSFARTIAGESELILLDEATSSVDSVTEDLIQKAIEKIFSEKTVIAIAHRLSTVQNSDQILVMKEGIIQERGSHQELIKQGGYYLELLNKFDSTAPMAPPMIEEASAPAL